MRLCEDHRLGGVKGVTDTDCIGCVVERLLARIAKLEGECKTMRRRALDAIDVLEAIALPGPPQPIASTSGQCEAWPTRAK